MMKFRCKHGFVVDGVRPVCADGDLNVLKRLILEKQQELMKIFVTPTRKRRNTGRHDQYDEVTVPAMARFFEAWVRDDPRREHFDAAEDFRDARFKDNTDDAHLFLRRSMHA